MNGRQLKISFFKALIFSAFFLGCNSQNANDCFQTAGSMIIEKREVSPFTRILVNEGIRLVVTQSEEYKVEVSSGKNLINEVTAVVTDDQLILSNNNTCNYFREYGVTTVVVSVPELKEIRSSTQFDIRSRGVLAFESLSLLSEGFLKPEQITSGEFFLELDVQRVVLVFNGLSNAFLSGKAGEMRINIAAGDCRIEAGELLAEKVVVNHRGSNDIFVNPQRELLGDLFGTGDLIAVNRPDSVAVTQHYRGKLIIQD